MKPRSIFALDASALLALPAAAQDMPLTDVLLPGEGWACLRIVSDVPTKAGPTGANPLLCAIAASHVPLMMG